MPSCVPGKSHLHKKGLLSGHQYYNSHYLTVAECHGHHVWLITASPTYLVVFVDKPGLKCTVEDGCSDASQKTPHHQDVKVVEVLKMAGK